jgi:hypothetical protein
METGSEKAAALREAMTSGVLVEFRDAAGNTLGQAVYLDWRGRPLPARGDVVSCEVPRPGAGGRRKLWGRVRSRQFDVQRDASGEACVWVRVVVAAFETSAPARAERQGRVSFSVN